MQIRKLPRTRFLKTYIRQRGSRLIYQLRIFFSTGVNVQVLETKGLYWFWLYIDYWTIHNGVTRIIALPFCLDLMKWISRLELEWTDTLSSMKIAVWRDSKALINHDRIQLDIDPDKARRMDSQYTGCYDNNLMHIQWCLCPPCLTDWQG